jgi:enoyl-CoA hydratase/carnithine racemase
MTESDAQLMPHGLIATRALEDGIRLVEFDAPPANALSAQLYADLNDLITAVEADEHTRVVVFASRHPKIFLAGADLRELQATGFARARIAERIDRGQATFLRIQRMVKPTLGVIDGHALGGGCEFALALDFRFMARGDSRIGLPEVTLGLMPAGGGTQRLPRLVGLAHAARLLMLGERLDADTAERVGLVTEASEDPWKTALAFAQRLARLPASSLGAIKSCLAEGDAGSLLSGLGVERAAALSAFEQPAAVEGVSAFLEKRPARFDELAAT